MIKSMTKFLTIVTQIGILWTSASVAGPNLCANIYPDQNRSQLLSSLIIKIDGVNWSLSPTVRRQAQEKLWTETYNAVYESPGLTLDEIRQLAWGVLTKPPRVASLRTDELESFLLESYLSKLNLGAISLHTSHSNYKDWLALLEKSGAKKKAAFKESYLLKYSGNFALTVQHIIKSDSSLTEENINQLVELLRISINTSRKLIIQKQDNQSNSNTYLTENRVADNFINLIEIDALRKNQSFIKLIQYLTAYLELNKYPELADTLRAAMEKKLINIH